MNQIFRLLQQKGMSQAFLSRTLGKSANTINNWCRNETQPSLLEAQKIAEILGCGIEELLQDDSNTKTSSK